MPATLTPAAWHTLSLPLNPLLGLGGVLLGGLLGGHWLMRILRVPPATASCTGATTTAARWCSARTL